MIQSYHAKGIKVAFVEINEKVASRFKIAGLRKEVGEEFFFDSNQAAIDYIESHVTHRSSHSHLRRSSSLRGSHLRHDIPSSAHPDNHAPKPSHDHPIESPSDPHEYTDLPIQYQHDSRDSHDSQDSNADHSPPHQNQNPPPITQPGITEHDNQNVELNTSINSEHTYSGENYLES